MLVCIVLRPLSPMADVPQVKEKLEWLASTEERYDTIFLGSSRVRRHISPQIFDTVMQEQGLPTNSFNLGIDGMTFPELDYVLKQCLATVQSPLRYVIIDLNQLRRRMMKGSDFASLREIHWHDLEHTRQACAAVINDFRKGEESASATARLLGMHGVLLVRHYSSTGGGADLLPLRPSNKKSKKTLPPGIPARGFYPVTTVLKAKERATYLAKLEEMNSSGPRPTQEDPVLERVLDGAAQAIRAAGAIPIFVVSPVVAKHRPQLPDTESASKPALIAFDDPSRHPSLFVPENRYDLQHLNLSGAELLTRLLAAEVVALTHPVKPAND